jgi:mediator of RNA polymerase II transcription subunit 14
MPGLLIMNSSGADARDGESRKRTHDGRLVNGDRTSKNDGAAANGTSPTPNMANAVISVKGSRTGASPEKEVEQRGLPLELVEVGDEFYRPLSKLYQRMAQECFNSLNETLRDMSNIIVQQQPNGVSTNGMGGQPNRNLDSSAAIEQKKILLLDFAYENRSKFIKLLVLTSWAEEKAIPIKKVIDMNAAMSHMIHGYDFVCEQFEIFRQSVRVLQEKNPDMRTALEILSKGKAEWIPDVSLRSRASVTTY